jgi:hypothetical protein
VSAIRFTPGAWRANFGEVIKVVDSDGATIAMVTNLNLRGRRSASEVAANAHLLAASPALLEALRPFANYACDEPCECHNCRARAAITQAVGAQS